MTFPIVIESPHKPPSTNNMFANVAGRGRIKSKEYNMWVNAAGWDCKRKGQCMGPFTLTVSFNTAWRRPNADLDNRIKPILDLLVAHEVVEDDNRCEAIHASWQALPAGIAFRAEVWPVRAP